MKLFHTHEWNKWEKVEEYNITFREDNGCPGTGIVWAALSKIMKEHDKNSTCWACALQGTNEIV